MWSCAPDPVDNISSTSDNGAGLSSEPFASGPEDGVKPCNLLPYMPADEREVLQQLQDIRLSGDVDEQSTSELDLLQKSSGVTREMPFHLLKEITDGFSNERKLGRGSYGVVYMGVPKCGPKIAVKMLHDMPGFDEEQFLNEFTNLERLDHPNIVRLLGYCYDIQKECHEFKGKIVVAEKICRVLCLEYMHYGSLDKYLSDEGLGLKWNICYKIIKGICKGLKYLHEESKPPVFHLDLKPANILLDENMQPKIADFGLSRFFGEEKTWITKNCVGTHGYVPPEYIERNLISNKFDIFSLGVVIIKIMTGRKGYIRSAEMSPQEFVELALKNWRTKIPKGKYLFIPYSEQVKKCMEIALSCVDADRHKRPTIGDVVKQLKIETDQVGNLSAYFPLQLEY